MDETLRAALHHSQVIDPTRTRDWIHNVQADPRVVVHLKRALLADLPATARVVTDADERRPLIEAAARRWGRTDVDAMLEHSPLIVLGIDDDAEDRPAGG